METLTISEKKNYVRGDLPPGPGCLKVESTLPTSYRVSLVSLFESFCSPNSPRILGTKSTIFQKLKIVKLSKVVLNQFQIITHLLGEHFFSHYSMNFERPYLKN